MTTQKIIREVYKIVRKYLPDAKIYLFGSFAKGNSYEGSDVDIAIDNGSRIDIKTLIRIKNEVEDIRTLRSIDIVDIFAVSDEFREVIKKEGVLVDGENFRIQKSSK